MNEIFIDNFMALCAIPHPSGHEEAISRYLYERALSKGLTARRDKIGNVIIDRPAAPGFENAPLTILQAHMDMVAVGRPGSDYDPLTSPITVVREGKSLRALDSSLGADDGAGLALIQQLLEDENLRCGPLRGIFTVNEETGMSGAVELDGAELNGKYLLNLDWETAGSLCCSCAGGELYRFSFAPSRKAPEAGVALELRVSGFLGGHSGTTIHTGRANAIQTIAGIIRSALDAGLHVELATIDGGSASNAIPNAASAVLVVPENELDPFRSLLRSAQVRFLMRFGGKEKNAGFSLQPTEMPETVLTQSHCMALMRFMTEAVIGVHTMSALHPELVESSANLSEVHDRSGVIFCEIYQRSSEPAVTLRMEESYRTLANACGATMSHMRGSPAWPEKPGSRLMELCLSSYRELTGEEMVVEAVHAGLECGSWAQKAPELDMISIGPDVMDIHSPYETLDLNSVDLLDRLVRSILADISRE
ncbi:MAG: aminoacyl-histidine dipeptidase [Ruminococcaceae bacterium]|nr:aminoacyl-histidine dipeptidase [Oscillospiraceae bacterium]